MKNIAREKSEDKQPGNKLREEEKQVAKVRQAGKGLGDSTKCRELRTGNKVA